MSEFFKAELKDRFLDYALENSDYFEVRLLYDEFLRPNYSQAYSEKLIREIIEFDSGLLNIKSGNQNDYFMVSATETTEQFLEEGGFTDLFIKEEEKWDNFLEHLSVDFKKNSGEKEFSKDLKRKSVAKERKLLYVLLGAVTISFMFTIFSLINSMVSKEEYVTKKDFDKALDDFRKKEAKKIEFNENLASNTVSEIDSTQVLPSVE